MATETRKFREPILCVAREAEEDPRCGATKLNKLLFYADFRAYRRLGRSISDHRYRKGEFGPVPSRVVPAVKRMVEQGECAWAARDYCGRELRKLIPLREPDLSVFSPEEIDLVRQVIDELWELNATEVSDLSHRFVGWKATEMGEEIPYATVFVGDPRPLSEAETEWAHKTIQEARGESAQSR